jgi:hypothetical protein
MSKVSKRTGPIAAALAIAGTAVAYSAASFAYDVDDSMLAMSNAFAIVDGESKVIADHRSPEPYRVCVAKGQNAVPVRVRYDGQERTIGVGTCDDLTARHITLSPAGKLGGDEELIGKYEHLKQ